MFLLKVIAKFVLWDYKRGSWQHEALCIAYILALIIIPTNSNGWFADGEKVALPSDAVITLHRYNTSLFLTWEEGSPEPQESDLRKFVGERFGDDSELVRDAGLGSRHYRIIPRGLR